MWKWLTVVSSVVTLEFQLWILTPVVATMAEIPASAPQLIGWTIPFFLTVIMNFNYILTACVGKLKECTAKCPNIWIGLAWAVTASNNFIMMSALYGRPGGGALMEGMNFNTADSSTVTPLDILFPLSSTLFYMIYVKKQSRFYQDSRVTTYLQPPTNVTELTTMNPPPK